MAFVASGMQVLAHESKFSLLMQDSDSGEEADSESWKKVGKSKKTLSTKESEGSSKSSLKNAKRRARKKKSRQLLNATDNVGLDRQESEDAWQQRNQKAVEQEYCRNLEEAMLNSVSEDPKRKQVVQEEEWSQKPSRPKKGTTFTLQELHRTTDLVMPARLPEAVAKQEAVELVKDDSAFFDTIHVSAKEQAERDTQQKQRGSVDLTNSPVEESARVAHLKDIAETKEQKIIELTKENGRLQCELQEVKQRTQLLCRLLSQGEIATKSDLLKQIDELTTTKDDLTKEVEQLHSSLEQERSRNKQLRAENLKLQSSRGNHKH